MNIKTCYKSIIVSKEINFFDKFKKNFWVVHCFQLFKNICNYLLFFMYVYLVRLSEIIAHKNQYLCNKTGISSEMLSGLFNGIYLCALIQGIFLMFVYCETRQKIYNINYVNTMFIFSISLGCSQIIFGYLFTTRTILNIQFYENYSGTYVIYVCYIATIFSTIMSLFTLIILLCYLFFCFVICIKINLKYPNFIHH